MVASPTRPSRSPLSCSRDGCPPRLPRNRACAVRTRLFETAGCDPRRRPVIDLDLSCSWAMVGWAGALMAGRLCRCSPAAETTPRRASTRCAGRDRRPGVAERPRRLAAGVDRVPRCVRLDAQRDKAASDRSLMLPVVEHDGPKTPTDVGVDPAHLLLLLSRDDPEELMPSGQPHVDLGDHAFERAAPRSRCQLADPVSRVALGALGEQDLHGPAAPALDDSQAKPEEVTALRTSHRRLDVVDPQPQAARRASGYAERRPGSSVVAGVDG